MVGADFARTALDRTPATALVMLATHDGDAQAWRAARDLAKKRFAEWCAHDADAAATWLATHPLRSGFRRLLAQVAAEVSPWTLVEKASLATEPSALLDCLSIGLRSAGGADGTSARAAWLRTMQRFPRVSPFAYEPWRAWFAKNDPAGLLALAAAPEAAGWSASLRNDGVIALAATDLGAAMGVIRQAPAGTFPPLVIARALQSTDPARMDEALGVIESLPDKPLFAQRFASSAQTWPEPERLKLLQWAEGQDEATAHYVTARLLPSLSSLSDEAVRAKLDGMLADRSAEMAVVQLMNTRGDPDDWIPWVQARGGLSPGAAAQAESGYVFGRKAALDAWKARHPGQSLADSLRRKENRQ